MPRPNNIQLNPAQSAFVDKEVASGRFHSQLDVVDAGLELLSQESNRIEALRAALEDGEQSGEPVAFDFQTFLTHCRRQTGHGA